MLFLIYHVVSATIGPLCYASGGTPLWLETKREKNSFSIIFVFFHFFGFLFLKNLNSRGFIFGLFNDIFVGFFARILKGVQH
jgi:hypothetical protein